MSHYRERKTKDTHNLRQTIANELGGNIGTRKKKLNRNHTGKLKEGENWAKTAYYKNKEETLT